MKMNTNAIAIKIKFNNKPDTTMLLAPEAEIPGTVVDKRLADTVPDDCLAGFAKGVLTRVHVMR